VRNEPESPLAANDDAAAPAGLTPRNEPDEPVLQRIAILRAAIMAEHTARLADPGRDSAIMDALVQDFQAAWAELPDAAAG
jgi:hypothetical protein